MRLLIAGLGAVAAFVLAAPSFAQTAEDPATAPAPAPVPTTKAKPGTTAYCQTLKSASSRSSCLKKLHAQASTKSTPTTAAKKTKKPSTTTTAPPSGAPKTPPDAAQLSPQPVTPTPAPSGGSVAVPPLPQKTI
jgi:hypothetical protein